MKEDPLLGDHLQPLLAGLTIVLLILHPRVEVATPSVNELVTKRRDNGSQALSEKFIDVLNQGDFWWGRERVREREWGRWGEFIL